MEQMLGKTVDPGQPLMEAGLDFLGAVELRTALGQKFNLELPATVTFDYPSAASLSRFLSSQTPANIAVRPRCHLLTSQLCFVVRRPQTVLQMILIITRCADCLDRGR